jgi:ML-like domain
VHLLQLPCARRPAGQSFDIARLAGLMGASKPAYKVFQRSNDDHVQPCEKGYIMTMLGDTAKNGRQIHYGHNLVSELRFAMGTKLPHRQVSVANPSILETYGPNRCQLRNGLVYWILVLVISFFSSPATAVLINFQNCLSQDYQNNEPLALQFVPLYVDAVFNTTDPSHNLKVTVWGNVNGSQNTLPLPPPNDPAWSNPNFTNGKIENLTAPYTKLTTLSNKVSVLTYEPWNENVDFCDRLVNGSCPLGPRFKANA